MVVPRPVQRALDSDDDLDTLADPCGDGGEQLRDDMTARFPLPPPPSLTSSPPPSTTTSPAPTTTAAAAPQLTYYWQNRNHAGGPSADPWYPWAVVPTTRVDSVLRRRPLLPPTTASMPRQLNDDSFFTFFNYSARPHSAADCCDEPVCMSALSLIHI